MAYFVTWGVLALAGVGALILAMGFGWGQGPMIGSAPLPVALSAVLVLVSLLALIAPGRAARERAETEASWRPFAAVVAAGVLFVATVEPLGLVPATVLTMLAAYLGQTERRYVGFAIYALCFAAAVWLLFTKGLGLPVPAFGG